MYKLAFFVPLDHAETVKSAVFAAGAGAIGDYEQCCFETRGKGQFCPAQGASPFLGEVGKLEHVEELKVEMVCRDNVIQAAVAALKLAHPYEEVAYDVWQLADI